MKGKEKVKLSKRFKTAFKAFKDESASSFNTVEVVLIVFISMGAFRMLSKSSIRQG